MKSAARNRFLTPSPKRAKWMRITRVLLAGVPALALAIGGCSIQEQTQGWHPRYSGVTAEAGDVGLRNVLVVASDDSQAAVLASFANRGEADELVEVRIGEESATPRGGSLTIPALGYATLEADTAQLNLSGAETGVTPGRIVEVEFRFAMAPRVTVDTLVTEAEGRYSHVFSPPPAAEEDSSEAAEPQDTENE